MRFFVVGLILHLSQVFASGERVVLTNDGPVVLGGKITFTADLFLSDGSRPSGTFWYYWKDNALNQHIYEVTTTNTTSYWTISYPAHDNYSVGPYRVEVTVKKKDWIGFYWIFGREVNDFEVTDLLNGNLTIEQSNRTVSNEFISSKSEADVRINLRSGDYDFVSTNATSVSTFWFVDCKFFGQSTNFTFDYNFTHPDTSHVVEALIVASFDSPSTTTTVSPTTPAPQTTSLNPNSTTVLPLATPTLKPNTTVSATEANPIETSNQFANNSFPFVCLNSSIVPPDPSKTYGYFTREVKVRAPISDITVDGTPWLQPWEMLSLNVSCKGSGPIHQCRLVYPGQYNVTGNETCKESKELDSCSFQIMRYFFDPGVYTIVVILENEVSKHISPLTINIYKATKKAQLSVIVVPVSCSLAAVVLVVFGVAYYIQSRARFTVEVADFDFGQHNPEMEYKTFTERLRDSFKSTVRRPGGDRISVWAPYYGSMNH